MRTLPFVVLFVVVFVGCGPMTGSADGGSAAGGSAAGGSAAGGSAAGGSAAGGSAAGGSAAGGSAAGGSAAGGSAGGAAAGGSAFPSCPANYAGCTTYEDRTGAGTTVALDFSTTFGTNKCLKLSASQSLSLTGVSGFHPLAQFCGPKQLVSAPQSAPVTLSSFSVGNHGFYCPNHAVAATGAGMGLGLQIVP